MKIIIMRHSDRSAIRGVKDQYQPLTEAGRSKALKTSAEIRKIFSGISLHNIFSSPYSRAIETAMIIAPNSEDIRIVKDLGPENSTKLDELVNFLKNREALPAVIIVGHNPQLKNLIKYLSDETINLERGSACCLEITDWSKKAETIWHYNPEENILSESSVPKRSRPDTKDIVGAFFSILALISIISGCFLMYYTTKIVFRQRGIIVTQKDTSIKVSKLDKDMHKAANISNKHGEKSSKEIKASIEIEMPQGKIKIIGVSEEILLIILIFIKRLLPLL
jgi:phosphohistidine phosphatase SixA